MRALRRPILLRLMAILAAAPVAAALAAGDPQQGSRLVDEKKCEGCHHNKTLGEAPAIYLRKDRKVTTWPKLRAQVALCNSELGLGMFPDEEEHVAAFLNERYYKFPRD